MEDLFSSDIFWIIIGVIVFQINSTIAKWGWHLKHGYRTEVAVGMLRGSSLYYLTMNVISVAFIFYSTLNLEVTIGWVIISIIWGRRRGKKEVIEIDTKLIMEEKDISHKAARIEAKRKYK